MYKYLYKYFTFFKALGIIHCVLQLKNTTFVHVLSHHIAEAIGYRNLDRHS